MTRPPHPRPRCPFFFERLEDRTLLDASRAVVTPAQLAGALTIEGEFATGTAAPDRPVFYELTPTLDVLLTARVHAPSIRTRLSLLDDQGRLLVQSDGLDPSDPDDLLALHLPAGTEYLEVESRSGVGTYTLTASLTAASAPFLPTLTTNSQNAPQILIGDFNGDHIPDIAASDGVHLGLTDGTFAPPLPSDPTAQDPDSRLMIASGDFNGDGKLDLAELNFDSDQVCVFLGNGDGTFQAAKTEPVGLPGDSPVALVVGDFNGDRKPDIATADSTSGDVSVLLNDGHGGFEAARNFVAGDGPRSIVAARFDGHLDLAVGCSNIDSPDVGQNPAAGGISILMGDGSGNFGSPTQLATGIDLGPFVTGDFNHDSRIDIAAVDLTDGDLQVFLGGGNGTFTGPITSPFSGITPQSLAVADFNGDGIPDIASANAGIGSVAIFQGRGNGTFGPPTEFASGSQPQTIATGDLNRDGRADVVVGADLFDLATSTYSGAITILEGNGDGTLRDGISGSVGGLPSNVVAGDFNNDGHVDLASADGFHGKVSILLGRGDGTFQDQIPSPTGDDPDSIAAGDFNGDGRLDLVSSNGSSGTLSVLLGYGDGTFQAPSIIDLGGDLASVAVGDFNRDGRIDLAVADDDAETVRILLGRGDGTFVEGQTIRLGSAPGNLLVGDVNRDGRSDLLFGGGGGLYVALGLGDGRFLAPKVSAQGTSPDQLALGDFNGDGIPDVVLTDGSLGTASLVEGRGDGTFGDPIPLPAGNAPGPIVVGDFNGDGHADVAIGNFLSDDIDVLFGEGHGAFSAPQIFPEGVYPNSVVSLVAADLNDDGRPDLAAGRYGIDDIRVLINDGAGQFSAPSAIVSTTSETPRLADLAGGVIGLVALDQSGHILWRGARPGDPGSFEPPVFVNPGDPARNYALVPILGGTLIVAADDEGSRLSLYTERDGEFLRLGSLSTGLIPSQILAGDLNGDGNFDLVVRDAGDAEATIYLGDGRGDFSRWQAVPVGLGASDLALANVDGSGRLDLLVADRAAGEVLVFPGRGDGTFGNPSRYLAGSGPFSLVQGDKGTSDLVSQEGTSVVISGSFSTPGSVDLLAVDTATNSLSVLDGLGGGTFADPRSIATGQPTAFALAADLTHDGLTDIITLGASGVVVELAEGNDQFRPGPPIEVGPGATGLSLADINGDGIPDLIVGNSSGDALVLLGDGNGDFLPYRQADQGVALAVADLRGDGESDFIFSNQALDHVSVQYGSTPPTVLSDRSNGLMAPGADILADLNGDGIPDLIVVNSGGNDVLVYLGRGDGEFGPEVNGGHGFSTGTDPIGLTVADLNGDGIPDLVVANQGSNDLTILSGQGRGARWTLVSGERIKTGLGPKMSVVRDINGDGIPDILVSDGQSNDVRLIRGVGGGFFNDTSPTIYPTGINPGPLFVADFSGRPGQLDLVTLNAGSNDLTLITDINDGGVSGQEINSGGLVPIAGVMGDFGGGGVDLLVANNGDGNLALFLGGNNGLTLFGDPFTDPSLPHPTDLERDGTTGLIYGTSEGMDAAFLVSLGLGVGGGGGGRGVGSSTLPSGPGDQQIAFLQPSGESALALLATILSVSIETTAEVTGLPNQPENDQAEITLDDEEEDMVTATPPPQATEIAAFLANYLSGLDESFADARAASGSREFFGESRSSRGVQVMDSLVARWSPLAKLAGPAPSVATRLGRWAVAAMRARGTSASIALPKGPSADLAKPISPTSGTECALPLLATHVFYGGVALALADRAGLARARQDEISTLVQ